MTSLFADLQRALALMITKDFQAAFDLYNQAAKHMPATAYKLCLYNNRGWAALNLKNYACAIFDASVAIGLSAKQRFPLALRSRSYEAIGLRSQALRVSACCLYVCMSIAVEADICRFPSSLFDNLCHVGEGCAVCLLCCFVFSCVVLRCIA